MVACYIKITINPLIANYEIFKIIIDLDYKSFIFEEVFKEIHEY